LKAMRQACGKHRAARTAARCGKRQCPAKLLKTLAARLRLHSAMRQACGKRQGGANALKSLVCGQRQAHLSLRERGPRGAGPLRTMDGRRRPQNLECFFVTRFRQNAADMGGLGSGRRAGHARPTVDSVRSASLEALWGRTVLPVPSLLPPDVSEPTRRQMGSADRPAGGGAATLRRSSHEHMRTRPTIAIPDVPSELDVSAIRAKTRRGWRCYTQEEFARAIGVPVGTLRHWEQRRRRPSGPALVLLALIDRAPTVVQEILKPPE
jgi:putative transcriptional regulator